MQPVAAAMDGCTCWTRRLPRFWRKRACWAENSSSRSKRKSPGRCGAGRKSCSLRTWMTARASRSVIQLRPDNPGDWQRSNSVMEIGAEIRDDAGPHLLRPLLEPVTVHCPKDPAEIEEFQHCLPRIGRGNVLSRYPCCTAG